MVTSRFKVMKIEKIVREEQNIIGAQEMLMPTVQSADICMKGRHDDYGEEMLEYLIGKKGKCFMDLQMRSK